MFLLFIINGSYTAERLKYGQPILSFNYQWNLYFEEPRHKFVTVRGYFSIWKEYLYVLSKSYFVSFLFPLPGWQVGNPWCFYLVRFPMNLRQERPTWSSASRCLWPGGRRGSVAGSLVWRRRCGSRCASASWSVATSSGVSAGTAAWKDERVFWREVSLFIHSVSFSLMSLNLYLSVFYLKETGAYSFINPPLPNETCNVFQKKKMSQEGWQSKGVITSCTKVLKIKQKSKKTKSKRSFKMINLFSGFLVLWSQTLK